MNEEQKQLIFFKPSKKIPKDENEIVTMKTVYNEIFTNDINKFPICNGTILKNINNLKDVISALQNPIIFEINVDFKEEFYSNYFNTIVGDFITNHGIHIVSYESNKNSGCITNNSLKYFFSTVFGEDMETQKILNDTFKSKIINLTKINSTSNKFDKLNEFANIRIVKTILDKLE